MHGESCERLADAAALILAVAIDPEALTNRTVPRTRPPRRLAAVPVRALLRADGIGDVGTLPSVSAGVGLAAGLFMGIVRVEAAATYGFAQHVVAGPRADTGADIQLLAVALRTCCTFARRGAEIGPCLSIETGWMQGSAFGISDPQSGGSPWLATLGGATLSWAPLGVLAFRLGLEAGPTIVRPRFFFDSYGTIHEPSRWIARAVLGVEFRFPP
jgi:hypothetical protein